MGGGTVPGMSPTVAAPASGQLARLTGRFAARIDGKGRLLVPAVHRPRFRNSVVLSLWPGHHIACYEPERWDAFVETLRERRLARELPRPTFDQIMGDSPEAPVDGNGRILVPQWMRTEVGLQSDAVLQGNDDHLGIYAAETFAEIDRSSRLEAAALLTELGV